MLNIDVERLALPTTVTADHKNGVSYIKAYIKALGINYYHHWRLDVPTIGTSVFRSISPFESLDVNPFQWDSNPKLVWPYCYIICSILDIYKNENLQNIRNYFGQSRFKILPDFFLSLSLSLSTTSATREIKCFMSGEGMNESSWTILFLVIVVIFRHTQWPIL